MAMRDRRLRRKKQTMLPPRGIVRRNGSGDTTGAHERCINDAVRNALSQFRMELKRKIWYFQF